MNRVKQNDVWLSPEDNKKFMAKRNMAEYGEDFTAGTKPELVEPEVAPEVEEPEVEPEIEDEKESQLKLQPTIGSVISDNSQEEEEQEPVEITSKTKKLLESLGIGDKPKKRGRPPKK